MTSVPTSAPPHPSPGLNPWLVRVPLLLLTGGMLSVLSLVTALFVYQIGVSGRVAPGVSAYGVPLGGKTPTEAADLLAGALTYPDDTVFTLRYGDQFWQFTAAELGLSFDVEATVQAAYALGHDGTPAQNLIQQAQLWFNGGAVNPVLLYDEAATLAALDDIAAQIASPPQDAALLIEGTTVRTIPAQPGTVVDAAAALTTIRERLLALGPGGEIPLTVREVQPTVTNAEETAAFVRAAISQPITLVAQDANGAPLGPWVIQPQQIAPLVQVALEDRADGTRAYTASVDFSGFAPTIQQLAPGLIIPARDGRFHFNDATGQLEPILPAVDGRALNVAETIRRMEEAAFRTGDRTVPLAFDYTLARYHNGITAAELGITGQVASSRTFFTGSTAARRQNIERGAEIFDGVIVAPGETFSFNDILGDVSEENGFAEGAIIFGGRTVKGIGGGICQVSTTVFRAAFTGGFPIVERYSHGYRVGYYELGGVGPGLDAAIFTPTADFKFQNDTDYHLLMETEFMPEIDAVEFRFYSTNPGRQVTISEPVLRNITPPTPTIYEVNRNLQPGQQLQVDWSQEGGDVIITRTIKDLDGNTLERRDYGTFYQPWSAVIQVPPGDPRLTQNS